MISARYRRNLLRQRVLPCLAFIAMPLCAQPQQQPEVSTAAQARPLDFSGAIALGAERNTNLSITELETASGTSDTAATLQANLDANWKPATRLSIAGGYSYSGSRYRELDSYDLDLHMVYVDTGWEIAGITLAPTTTTPTRRSAARASSISTCTRCMPASCSPAAGTCAAR